MSASVLDEVLLHSYQNIESLLSNWARSRLELVKLLNHMIIKMITTYPSSSVNMVIEQPLV